MRSHPFSDKSGAGGHLVQTALESRTASSLRRYCMDAMRVFAARCRRMGVLPHIKKLDDALGHFLVQITCKCGAQRIAEPQVLARLCGSSATLEAVARRMRCSKCGAKVAAVVAIAIPRIRGRGFRK